MTPRGKAIWKHATLPVFSSRESNASLTCSPSDPPTTERFLAYFPSREKVDRPGKTKTPLAKSNKISSQRFSVTTPMRNTFYVEVYFKISEN